MPHLIPGNITEFERDRTTWARTPAVEGAIGAMRGALIGAPLVGFVNALRGGSPLLGGIAGGIGGGLFAGLFAATQQRLENIDREAELRYYADNLRSKEPFFFMPPPRLLDRVLAAANFRRSATEAGESLAKKAPLRILHVPERES